MVGVGVIIIVIQEVQFLMPLGPILSPLIQRQSRVTQVMVKFCFPRNPTKYKWFWEISKDYNLVYNTIPAYSLCGVMQVHRVRVQRADLYFVPELLQQ